MPVDLTIPTHPVVLAPVLLCLSFALGLLVLALRRRIRRPVRGLRADVEALHARVEELEARLDDEEE